MHELSLVAASGGYSSLQCAGFSLRWLLLLWSMGSRCTGFSSFGSRAVEHRLSSCGARAWLLCGMWGLPGPGLEPVSPALAGGFLTTTPPGMPNRYILNECLVLVVMKARCVLLLIVECFSSTSLHTFLFFNILFINLFTYLGCAES